MGPYMVEDVYSNGIVDLIDSNGIIEKVNTNKLKPY